MSIVFAQMQGSARLLPEDRMGTRRDASIVTDTDPPEPQIKAGEKRPRSASPPTLTASSKQETHLAYNALPPSWLNNQLQSTEGAKNDDTRTLRLTYHVGDMFSDAPENCLLIHACNTQGHWGAGIAKAFKLRYPKAYTAHHEFCAKEHSKANPVPTGSAQLLAPVDAGAQHWLGCLFTSAKYGKAKDQPDVIVKNTGSSMGMLLELVRMGGSEISEVRMCKINSGKFGVPWAQTEKVLKDMRVQGGWRGEVQVWEP
ncbi:ADP-ribose 1''-phosphate phosphatase [Pleosporales sp. CAS-2024a]